MDHPPPIAAASHQRARGGLHVSFKRRGAATVLDGLRQEGCLKVRFPRPGEPGEWAGAVTLNSAGGVAGGDRLVTSVIAGPGTEATVATQAAERIYRALPGATADIRTTLRVAPGAALEWLPQETILFDRCALDRSLHIDLAADARFLGVEALVFGRTAMDEQVHEARLHDRVILRRDGRIVLFDAVRQHGPLAARLARPATAAGARAVATIVHAAPDAAARLGPLRAALAAFEAGASAFDGLLVARILAPDGAALREALVTGLNILRGGRRLPRVWLC